MIDTISQQSSKRPMCFYHTEVECRNELGELLFKKHNTILMGGRRFTLEKLFNVTSTSSRVVLKNGTLVEDNTSKDAEDGKIGIIKSSAFNNGVEPKQTSDSSSGNYMKALIELHQYLKAQWSLDIGISSNFNMKRERQNTAEVESNAPYLLPLVDAMLKFRKIICDEVHEMFPEQNWTVELNSAWALENQTQELQVESLKSQSEESRNLEGVNQ